MIRLVKIELKKLFAKKMIYIFLAILVALNLLIVIIDKNAAKVYDAIEYDMNEKLYKESMDSYDLKDPEQLQYYVEDKDYYDMIILTKGYKTYSAEQYYIRTEMSSTIQCMNHNEFISKDKDAYNECKKTYDEQLEFLKHYNWKEYVNQKLDEVNDEISSIEFGKNSGALSGEEIEKELSVLKLTKEVLEYRLDNNVPIDGSYLSGALEQYVSSYSDYMEYDNDKNLVSRFLVMDKREAEAAYYINKYKFEHGMFKDYNRDYSADTTATVINDVFLGGMFTILFLVLVGGSIVAEEFNKGTIKQLLLKPYKRSKIIISKIIAALLVFFIFMVVYALLIGLINGIAYWEFKSLFEPVLVYNFNTGKVVEQSLVFNCLEHFVALLPKYLMLLGIAILVGVTTTNTAIALIIPIVTAIGSTIINEFADKKIFAYFPTMCWDLTEFLHGGMPTFKYSTLPICIVVDIVTIVLLFGISVFIFNRKDIKNQ